MISSSSHHSQVPNLSLLRDCKDCTKWFVYVNSNSECALDRRLADIMDLAYGDAPGVFKRKVDPVDLHQMIGAECFFRVSNRHRKIISDMILTYLKS